MAELTGAVTAVHSIMQLSLDVSVMLRVVEDGTSIAHKERGFDWSPSPMPLTDEIVYWYI